MIMNHKNLSETKTKLLPLHHQFIILLPQVPEPPPEAVEVLVDEGDPVAIQVEGIGEQPVVVLGVREHALLLDRAVVVPGLPHGVLPALAVQEGHQASGDVCCGAVLVRAHLHPARVLPLNRQKIPQSAKNLQ